MLALSLVTTNALAVPGDTTLVSLDSTGRQGNDSSVSPSISSDGRYVAFVSSASNLVDGDTNGRTDIFVHDRDTHTTTRVSLDSTGTQGNDWSTSPSISSDGRYVAFESWASNLVGGDTNAMPDIFVRDRNTNTTTRVSLDSTGTQGKGYSYTPFISSDGRYVAFVSGASNLVDGDTNEAPDIFVRDRNTHTTTRISLDSTGMDGNDSSDYPSISSDGRYVAFLSAASNLVDGDTNAMPDIFVRDLNTNTTTRISLDSTGRQGNNSSVSPSISSDGRYVAFVSSASNLVDGDTNGQYDIFVRDCSTHTTTRVSLDSTGTQGDSSSFIFSSPSISSDGRYVAFESYASNLVDGDTNMAPDIFVRELDAPSYYASVGMLTTAFNYNEGWRVDMHPRLVGDVNGDGKDDLVGIGYSSVFVAIANTTGTGFYSPRIWSNAFNYNEGWRVDMHPRLLGDVNGDGKDDLVGIGYAGVFVALANSAGTGFNSPSIWSDAFNYNEGWRVNMHPRLLGDVNGDGKADLVGIGYAGVFVALANSAGNEFNSPSIWSDAFNYNEGWRVNMHPRLLGDVNGDGKADLVGFGYHGIFVALANSAGDGFDSPTIWTTTMTYSNAGWMVDQHPRVLGDVNGDGKADLVGFGYDGVFVALANSAGNSFSYSSMWTTAFNYDEGWMAGLHPRMVGDINGDGKDDLIGFGYAGVFVAAAK